MNSSMHRFRPDPISLACRDRATSVDVRVDGTLEDSFSDSTSEGPTRASGGGREAPFEPRDPPEPKGKAVRKLIVSATHAADVRFKAPLTGDHVERPVEQTEPTPVVVWGP